MRRYITHCHFVERRKSARHLRWFMLLALLCFAVGLGQGLAYPVHAQETQENRDTSPNRGGLFTLPPAEQANESPQTAPQGPPNNGIVPRRRPPEQPRLDRRTEQAPPPAPTPATATVPAPAPAPAPIPQGEEATAPPTSTSASEDSEIASDRAEGNESIDTTDIADIQLVDSPPAMGAPSTQLSEQPAQVVEQPTQSVQSSPPVTSALPTPAVSPPSDSLPSESLPDSAVQESPTESIPSAEAMQGESAMSLDWTQAIAWLAGIGLGLLLIWQGGRRYLASRSKQQTTESAEDEENTPSDSPDILADLADIADSPDSFDSFDSPDSFDPPDSATAPPPENTAPVGAVQAARAAADVSPSAQPAQATKSTAPASTIFSTLAETPPIASPLASPLAPAPAPPTPAPAPPAPTATQTAPTQVAPPQAVPAQPAPPTAPLAEGQKAYVPTPNRAHVTMTLDVVSIHCSDAELQVGFGLYLVNKGERAATNVNIRLDLQQAQAQQQQRIDAFFDGQGGTILREDMTLAAGSLNLVQGKVTLPLDRCPDIVFEGQRVVVPVIALDINYGWDATADEDPQSRTVGKVASAFLLGEEVAARHDKPLKPLYLDRTPYEVAHSGARTTAMVRTI